MEEEYKVSIWLAIRDALISHDLPAAFDEVLHGIEDHAHWFEYLMYETRFARVRYGFCKWSQTRNIKRKD